MRQVMQVGLGFAACAFLAMPAAAQDGRWMLGAHVGPAFGTLGTAPQFDALVGFKVSPAVAVVAESGVIRRSPYEKGEAIAPAPATPSVFTDRELYVSSFHHNANVRVAPAVSERVAPYLTGGMGMFIGSTVERGSTGTNNLIRYQSENHLATNLGGGVTFSFNRWLGLNADYRLFLVDADSRERVNRFTIGVALSAR